MESVGFKIDAPVAMPGAKKASRFKTCAKPTKSTDDARRMTVDAGEGLHLVLTALGDVTEGKVQVAAEAPTMPPKTRQS